MSSLPVSLMKSLKCISLISDFTEEKALKDTHMIINRMTCGRLTKTMLGKFACQSEGKVKNYYRFFPKRKHVKIFI